MNNWKTDISIKAIEVLAKKEADERELIERELREQFRKGKLLTAFVSYLGITAPAIWDDFVTIDGISFSVIYYDGSSMNIRISASGSYMNGQSFGFRYITEFGSIKSVFTDNNEYDRLVCFLAALVQSIRLYETPYISELAS